MILVAGSKSRHRNAHRAVSLADVTRDSACLDPPANGIDRMFPL
jgi:hypothetical protein